MAGYLFVHFIGEKYPEGEQIYFSVSEDGLHWQDLNGGQPVLRSPLGELGVRDPFIVRHPQTGKYYLIATDLCMYSRKDWSTAVSSGSRDLIVWSSDDLLTWSEPRSCTVGVPGAGCVWAPEAVWDEEKSAYMVFFASMVQVPGDEKPKHRIYATHTQDFLSFTPAEVYAEAENHLIDMTIVREDGWYYRFTKDETTKRILTERMRSLHEPAELLHSETLENLPGVEGPECYQLPDGRWCLIVDQFQAGLGYLPLVTPTLAACDFSVLPAGDYDMGQGRKRHGGVIGISNEEMQGLMERYQ